MASLYSVLCAVFSLGAVWARIPGVNFFYAFSYSAILMWVLLTALSITSNVAGVVISKAEHCQRLNPNVQKLIKGFSCARLSATCASSYRAGHSRARRSHSHSASSNASSDGESDSGDSPALPLPSVVPSLNFSDLFCKPNNFPSPWCCLYGLGCWHMSLASLFAGRGWWK